MSTVAASLLLVTLPLTAQDAIAPAAADGRLVRLTRALEKTSAVRSLSFAVRSITKPAPTLGADRPWRTVDGRLAGGLLHVRGEDDQELLAGGRLVLVRRRGEPWQIRAGRGTSGDLTPYVFDPGAFLAAVQTAPLTVARAEVEVWNGRPCELYSVTLDGGAARELIRTGVLPYTDRPCEGVVWMPVGADGKVRVGDVRPPRITVDLAFSIDPASGLVHRVQAQVTEFNSFAFAALFAGTAAELELPSNDAQPRLRPASSGPPPPRYEEGLPLRQHSNGRALAAASQLDVRFSHFDSTAPPDLDPKVRALLR